MPDQFSAAASTYGIGTVLIIGVLIVVGLVAANWQKIKATIPQPKLQADPIAEALELAKQLDALHKKLGLSGDEREAALADVVTRAFRKPENPA
jgi:hypothetical protein